MSTHTYQQSWDGKWAASVELPWTGVRIGIADTEAEAQELARQMEAEEKERHAATPAE